MHLYLDSDFPSLQDSQSATRKRKIHSKETDGDDDENPSASSLLLDASLELLSAPVEHSIKGAREAIKRVWMATTAVDEVDLDTIDEILTAVLGDDADDDDDEEAVDSADNGGSEDEHDDGESAEESENEEEDDKVTGLDSKEDVHVKSDQLFSLLEEDMDDGEAGRKFS
jgi:hypothetical protein